MPQPGPQQKVIVLIEDEKIISHLLVKKLEACGYTVQTADNGRKGIALVKETHPDLILLDMMLPHIDGFGVLEALREVKIIPQTPLLIISNSGQPIEIGRALKLGARDYLIKVNFDPQDVVEKVRRIFDQDEGRTNREQEIHLPIIRETDRASAALANQPKQNPQTAPIPNQEQPAALASQPNEKGGQRILLIEDDLMLVQLLERKLLQQNKYEVRKAFDVPQARTILDQYGADIVLLDIVLPGTDGFTFLSELKANQNWKEIPVIIMSNLGQQEEIKRGKEGGAVDYVVKAHANPQEIIEKIETVLHNK